MEKNKTRIEKRSEDSEEKGNKKKWHREISGNQ
jgi:hypothetical protein